MQTKIVKETTKLFDTFVYETMLGDHVIYIKDNKVTFKK